MFFWGLFQTIPRSADRESLVVQQFTDTPHQKDFVVLVVTAVTAPLDRLELSELLFPITKDVGFHTAQIADFSNGEITLGRNGG